jgi:GH35 family endo-1,4-beta-xylanase
MKKIIITTLIITLLTACTAPVKPAETTIETTTTEAITTTTAITFEPVFDESLRAIAYADNLPSLKDAYADYFLMGAAIDVGHLREGSATQRIIDKHYNFLTTGNELKPEYINTSEGVFEFETPDQFIAYGDSHPDVKLRGHTLVWHSQVPAWWFENADSEKLMARMEEYITTVVGRYKGKIDTWDVVNEPISDSSGDLRRDSDSSKWVGIVGDLDGDGYDSDYIEQAFIFADKADPDAQLIINDYNIEFDTKKMNAMYDLIERMLLKGIPVDGVGLQCHVQLGGTNAETIEKAIEKFAELKKIKPDFAIQITELDVSIFSWNDQSKTKEITPELEIELAEYYRDLYEMFKRQAEKGNLELVVSWGFYDGASWLDGYPVVGRVNAPLLFNRRFYAKPAFWGVVDPTQIEACAAEPQR